MRSMQLVGLKVGYKDRIVKQIYHLGLVANQALTCFRRLANKKFVIVLDYFVELFIVDIFINRYRS